MGSGVAVWREAAVMAPHRLKMAYGAREEEEEDVPESLWRYTGLGQLYRGLGMRLSASAIVFVIGMLSGGDDADAGWAEL